MTLVTTQNANYPLNPDTGHASHWKNYLWILVAVLGGILGYIQDRALYTAVAVPYAIERQIIDAVTFGKLGQQLWQGHPEVLYATPYNQAGPLQNLSNAAIITWAHHIPYPYGWVTIHILIATTLLLTAGGVAWWGTTQLSTQLPPTRGTATDPEALKVPQRWLWTIPLLTVCLFVALSAGSRTFTDGHWWQIFVVFLWYMSGWFTLHQRPFIAGILIGISIGYEPWGIFGILILLVLSKNWTHRIYATLTATIVTFTIWGPFLFLWDFTLLQYKWSVLPSSMWAPILSTFSPTDPHVEGFPWTYRVAQAGIVVGIFLVFAWKWRKSILASPTGIPLFLLLPPLIIMLRVSTDVWFGAYYVTTAQVFLVPALLTGLLIPGARWLFRAVCSFGALYFLLMSSGLPGTPFLHAGIATALTILVAHLLSRDIHNYPNNRGETIPAPPHNTTPIAA